MRIISGKYGGRVISTPKGNKTHPMGDRVRMAMFNKIQDEIEDKRILDAYAGSGAISIECLSRGASFVQIIDKDKNAIQCINENLELLNVDARSYKVTQANCVSWSDNNPNEKFDVIFVDPPFDKLNLSTINNLTKHLTRNGLMVLSHSGRETVSTVDKVVVVDDRMYGEATLSYYRKVDH